MATLFRIEIDSRAVAEIADAAEWYEAQREGLGERFLQAFDDVIARLTIYPHSYSQVPSFPSVRRVLLKRFPYSVFYWCDETTQSVQVLACFHERKNPGDLRERLGDK